MMIIGYAGLALLIVAWISELFDIVRNKKEKIDTKFAVFYIIGSILLLIYSIQIKNIIFIIMKVIVLAISLVSLYYSLKLHKR
jgi:lipid-A-disaccharide synthase-like uncharacterized protein